MGVLERSFSKFSKKESRGERPAAFWQPCFQSRRPLAGLDLEGPKAGPRPAVLIYFINKKKKKKKEEKGRE